MQKLLLSSVCAAVADDGWSCRTRPQALDKRCSSNPVREMKRPAAATVLPIADTGVLGFHAWASRMRSDFEPVK